MAEDGMRVGMLCTTLPLLGACYFYDPVEQPAPVAGTRIEAELTGAGAAELATRLGPQIATLRGHLLESDQSSLLLSINSVTEKNHERTSWKGEQVRIPLSTVSRVHQRKFSLGRTLMLGGAAIGALVAAVVAFDGGGSAVGGGVGTGGGPGGQ
jgi:hypothetical protein